LEYDTDHILRLAARWGNSPRTLLNLHDGKQSEEDFQTTIDTSASTFVMEADAILAGLRSFNLPIEKLGPSSILFIRPQQGEHGIASRTRCEVYVPTIRIGRSIARATMEKGAFICSQFFAATKNHASMRGAAGYIFEQWVHACLVSGHKLDCKWLNNDSMPQETVAIQPDRLISTRDELKTCRPPFYWCPVASNFPGIDGLLRCEDDVYAIQITISRRHTSPEGGLRTLQKDMDSGLHWTVLFIGTDMEQAEKVAKPWMWIREDPKRKRGEQETETETGTGTKYIPVGICALPLNSNFNGEMVDTLQKMEPIDGPIEC